MTSKGRLFKVVAAGMPVRLASSFKASSALAACGGALLAVGLVTLGACGARDAGELFGATGEINGAGGAGSSASGAGGLSSSSSTAVSSSSASSVVSASSSSAESSSSSSSSAEASSSSSGGPVTVKVLPEGSGYLYWDKGSVAAGWADPSFDDGGWEKGTAPLGYGDANIVTTVEFGPNTGSKFITTWFRTTFDVKNVASVTAATLELMLDDGARAFLNGAEAARSNLPNGAITPNTLASDIVQGADELTFLAFTVDPKLLVEGPNVLAIEVHQAVADSSDLGMDARVTLEQLTP